MLKDQLAKMLANQEPVVKEVIQRVLALEQANISFERPHLKNDIDQIIDVAAKRLLEREETER